MAEREKLLDDREALLKDKEEFLKQKEAQPSTQPEGGFDPNNEYDYSNLYDDKAPKSGDLSSEPDKTKVYDDMNNGG